MYLTMEEKRMLAGGEGELIREAMRFLTTLGEAYDAERMVDICYANIILGSSFWGKGALTRQRVEEAVDLGLRVKVPTTFNNWGMGCPSTPGTIWDSLEVPPKVKEQVVWENELARRMGVVPTCTCAPFLNCDIGVIPKGAHISTVESSAIVYFNSVLGARANRDCVASFFAAITGKYPLCGFHLAENRYGNYHLDVEARVDSPLSYGLLGLCAGKIAGRETPVFTGLNRPGTYALMSLSAALASSGAVTMFHIVGHTPEAPDFETAFGGKSPVSAHTITQADMDAAYRSLSDVEGRIDFVCLGCPHYSIYEMAHVAELLDGRKVCEGITVWICVSAATAQFAEMAGYAEKIRNAGAIIMSGPNFCPVFGPGKPCPEYAFAHPDYSVGNFATESVKQAFYAKTNLRARNVFLGSREQCIEAAITGAWKKGQTWV
ncbi:MAG: aconitase X catalytic domain-containing protein [Lentisphaerae bacterium]|nr:aconitase X catalytic domain-containing protein [Lentisphaerota bacterium]